MPEIVNIPVLESVNARYKPVHPIRMILIIAFLLLSILLSLFIVRYFFAVEAPASKETVDRRIPSISERMDALHSKVAELQIKIANLQTKNGYNLKHQKPLDIFQQVWPQTYVSSQGQELLSVSEPFTKVKQLQSLEKDKRMVSWQPVKRGSGRWAVDNVNAEEIVAAIYDMITRENGKIIRLIIAISIIEQQLAAVLHAGSRLGISTESILEHLRTQRSKLKDG